MMACQSPDAWDNYVAVCKLPPVNSNQEPTALDTEAVALMRKYPVELFAAFHDILDKRPKTLTHGDMRGDNMFKKKDGSGFSVIDWQTYGAAPPGWRCTSCLRTRCLLSFLSPPPLMFCFRIIGIEPQCGSIMISYVHIEWGARVVKTHAWVASTGRFKQLTNESLYMYVPVMASHHSQGRSD